MSDWREIHGEQNQRMAQKMLEQQAEINKLRAERDAWHNRAEALEKLAAHYRIGSRPSEKRLLELERARRAIDALQPTEGAQP